ncbi:DUF6731 family protein [Methylobacter sp. S3L5C]|uniref:DUF6731 family protein n=1 Tax=Methylobacter sp. S3L5C TaxID=2839024 RepID=UPI001FAD0F0A|nr:DUF6731 family protein [Methylobacter sp. S3L5C]UOA10014.1 hypothetical protein KKZ03_07110 [Methylobacter sp. S3L5C]
MQEKMNVHAFSVVPVNNTASLETLLAEISKLPLELRIRTVSMTDYRIEHIEQKDDGYWYVDFGKFRSTHGPGAASKTTPIRGFVFQTDEVFCEETAFLYDPHTKHAIIQYNHYGTRAGAMQDFFNSFVDAEVYVYEFRPKYDADVERRFLERQAITKLDFAIDPRLFNNDDRVAGTSLAQAIDIGNQSNGSKLEVTISAGRKRNHYLSDIIDNTAVLLKLKSEENPFSVSRLQVGILQNLDAKIEIVDLIAQRLSRSFNDICVGEDLRFTREARYQALNSAFNSWVRLF